MESSVQFVPECMVCHVRQAVSLLERSGVEPDVSGPVTKAVFQYLATTDLGLPNPVISARVQDIVRGATCVDDPYATEKKRAN